MLQTIVHVERRFRVIIKDGGAFPGCWLDAAAVVAAVWTSSEWFTSLLLLYNDVYLALMFYASSHQLRVAFEGD